jgi:hypothetical protein
MAHIVVKDLASRSVQFLQQIDKQIGFQTFAPNFSEK